MFDRILADMKRTNLGIIGIALILGTGCHSNPTPTNGGLSPTAPAQIGLKSSNGKAQTGAIMRMDRSNVPPMLAKKMKLQ